MGHYSWLYESNTCIKCGKTDLDGLESTQIGTFEISKRPELKEYEGKHICAICLRTK